MPLALLLLLVLPRLSFSSFSSTLDEVKESLLEREGLRSLASFLSFNPEERDDVEEVPLTMSSSRYIFVIYPSKQLNTFALTICTSLENLPKQFKRQVPPWQITPEALLVSKV